MDVLLYATENPRNLGSIIRTSVGFGLPRIHIYDKNKLLRHEDTLATMKAVCRRGREHKIEIKSVDDPEDFVDSYTHKYATLISTRSARLGDSEENFRFERDGLIIFGCEGIGLPRKISRRNGVQKILIPTINEVQCFGLAEAYSIIIYEYLNCLFFY